MLTALAVSDTLRTAFPRTRVQAVLEAVARVGMVKPGPTTVFSVHSACVAAIACAIREPVAARALAAAMRGRDYMCQGLAPGWRPAVAVEIGDLRTLRAIRVMIAEVYTQRPGPWWIAADEIANSKLRFWAAGGGERLLERPDSLPESIPAGVLEGFARHNGAVGEDMRRANQLLMARISKSVRTAPTPMTGAERSSRHRERVAAEAEAAE